MGVVRVEEGAADISVLELELANLIEKNWNWHVKQLSKSDFLVWFPNKATLDTFSRISGLMLGQHNLKVKISESDLDLEASATLNTA